jgi:hypothetical protein
MDEGKIVEAMIKLINQSVIIIGSLILGKIRIEG